MNYTNIYYKKIIERFGKKAILESETNSTTPEDQSGKSSTRVAIPSDFKTSQFFSESLLKKR